MTGNAKRLTANYDVFKGLIGDISAVDLGMKFNEAEAMDEDRLEVNEDVLKDLSPSPKFVNLK